MSEKAIVINQEQMKTSLWSGGTTTQIMIYPENGDYKSREFVWRLSTAKVELEESDFTHLPGIHRIIMVIDGRLEIKHEGHYEKVLAPYDKDEFEGSWTTHSKGKVTDFNLMLQKEATGGLFPVVIPAGHEIKHRMNREEADEKKHSFFFYCAETGLVFDYHGCTYSVPEKGLLFIESSESDENIKLTNLNGKATTIIYGEIIY